MSNWHAVQIWVRFEKNKKRKSNVHGADSIETFSFILWTLIVFFNLPTDINLIDEIAEKLV